MEKQGTKLTLHNPLKPLTLLLRHRVPKLRRPKVNVVDRVKVGVLDVPSEGRSPHAKVEVGGDDAGDLAGGRSETREEVA